MSRFNRQYNVLENASNVGGISPEEYFAGMENLGFQEMTAGLNKTLGSLKRKSKNSANFQKAAGPLSTVGNIAGQFSNINGSIDGSAAQAREGMRGVIGQMGPWGAAIAAATGVVDTVSDATGIALNTVDKNAAGRAGAGAAAGFNNLVASLPGFSFLGGLTGKTDDAEKSQFIDRMSNSYGGSVQDINAAQDLGGKRTLFGKKKINSFIQEQNRVNSLITSIGMQSELAKQNDAGQLYQQQNANKYAGYSPRLLLSKKGGTIPELETARTILKSVFKKDISKYQLGGKIIDPSKNIIPDGALHKNKNHLSEHNDELKDQITEKGIPVVSENADGTITQHAEVEVGEVIFNLANTKIIEDYWQQYKETGDDSIAIECGKFLTKELLRNTVDKAGIKKEIE